MRRILAGLGVLGLSAAPAFAGDPSAESLVERLGSVRYAVRSEAARELRALGETALPALDRAARSAAGLDARLQAEQLAAIVRTQAESARVVAVTPLRLDYHGVPLATVVDDLRSRTGIPLVLDTEKVADPLRPVSLTAESAAPWEAVDLLCRAAGVREVVPQSYGLLQTIESQLRSNGVGFPAGFRGRTSYSMAEIPRVGPGDLPITLADGVYPAPAGDRRSAVRVSALPPDHPGHRVILGKNQTDLLLDVSPLPSVKWHAIEAVRVTRVSDEAGRPVVTVPMADSPSEVVEYISPNMVFGGGFQPAIDINDDGAEGGVQSNPRLVAVRLRSDGRVLSRLKRLEGIVVGQVVHTDQQLLKLDDLAGSLGLARNLPGDAVVTVVGHQTAANGRTVVRVRAEYPNPWTAQRLGGGVRVRHSGIVPPPASGTVMLGSVGQVTFFDAAGRRVTAAAVGNTSMMDDGFRQTYEIEVTVPAGKDYGPPVAMAVVGERPATVEVPFALENVRLP